MKRAPARLLRVLLIPQAGQWLAQCLDYNIAAQGATATAASRSLMRILRAHLMRDHELGREPLAGLRPAPERFWALWEEIERHSSLPSPEPIRTAEDDEGFDVPLYMLAAVSLC